MRTCTKCLQTKDESEYFIKDKETGRLHTQCKACYKEHRKTYHKDHYNKYGDAYRARAKERRKMIQKQLHANMITYLQDKACVLCGESDIRTLEFDHLDHKEKKIGVAKAITDGMKWEAILQEIQKCRILCANCHKKHTATMFGWYKNT